jgi:hypothetical protein
MPVPTYINGREILHQKLQKRKQGPTTVERPKISPRGHNEPSQMPIPAPTLFSEMHTRKRFLEQETKDGPLRPPVNEGPNDDLVRVGIVVLLEIPQPLANMVVYLAGKRGSKYLVLQNPDISRKKIARDSSPYATVFLRKPSKLPRSWLVNLILERRVSGKVPWL